MPNRILKQLLPRSVDALKFCQQRAEVAGVLPLTVLPRLSGLLYAMDGEVNIELFFTIDEQSRKRVNGELTSVLLLQCQRCLDRVEVPVSSSFSLALVWSDDQAASLPRNIDPVLMVGSELDLYGIVEDELLLALPLVAIHQPGECVTPPLPVAQECFENVVVTKKKNPFQVLASLKSGDTNGG